MSEVEIAINGRGYTVACDAGQEQHLRDLARDLDRRIAGIVESSGQIGDNRLLLMAGLLLADELADSRNELQRVTGGRHEAETAREDGLAEAIEQLAARLEAIAARLEAA